MKTIFSFLTSLYFLLRFKSILFIIFTFSLFSTNSFAEDSVSLAKQKIRTPANHASANAVLSSDARFVAFHSAANNLIANDTNNKQDVFVYDRNTGKMERVSVSSDGNEANHYSLRPSISGDGRFVTFMSLATNLVDNQDNNHQLDIFLHDRKEKTTTLVSISRSGNAGNTKSLNPVISKDGNFIAFESFSNNLIENDENENADIFIYSVPDKKIELISISSRNQQANHGSSTPAISAEGRFVVFHSPARNLVPEDNKRSDENEWNFSDVFLRDRELNKTELVSANLRSKPGNHPSFNASISSDGNFISFTSMATDLVPEYPATPLYVGGKGRVARRIDIYVRDIAAKATQLVSIASDGSAGNHQSQAPKISADGRYVTFQSAATNLVGKTMPGITINIYRRDLQEGKTNVVTYFDGPLESNVMAAHSAVSNNGETVVFDSNYGHKGAPLANESDVYVWNASTGKLELISFAHSH